MYNNLTREENCYYFKNIRRNNHTLNYELRSNTKYTVSFGNQNHNKIITVIIAVICEKKVKEEKNRITLKAYTPTIEVITKKSMEAQKIRAD